MLLSPIGYVTSTRAEARDDHWDSETASIALTEDFASDALVGLDTFSHVEIVYYFHRVPDEKIEHGARHPRGNEDWRAVGIFAQRGKNRPNRLGISVCRIIGIEGKILRVDGLDAIDSTPVLDVKPWMAEFGPRGVVQQPEWSTELMRDYW